jgi:hypothetical protein
MASDSVFSSVAKFFTDFLSNPMAGNNTDEVSPSNVPFDTERARHNSAYKTKESLDKAVYSDSQRKDMARIAKLLQHTEADIANTTSELATDRGKLKATLTKYRSHRGKRLPPDVALTLRDYKISIAEKTKHLEKLYGYKRKYTQILYKSRTHAAHKQYTELMHDEELKSGYAPTQFELREAEKLAKQERKIERDQQRLDIVSGAMGVDDCLDDLDDIWNDFEELQDHVPVEEASYSAQEEGDIVFPSITPVLPVSPPSYTEEEEDELEEASEALAD